MWPLSQKIGGILGVVIFLTVLTSSCVTRSKAEAMARAAYHEGEQAALASMNANRQNVVVLGDVETHEVPYVAGLTLAQAIATARYDGLHDPKIITLNRHGETGRINPKDLLRGSDIPLEPGDIITVQER